MQEGDATKVGYQWLEHTVHCDDCHGVFLVLFWPKAQTNEKRKFTWMGWIEVDLKSSDTVVVGPLHEIKNRELKNERHQCRSKNLKSDDESDHP